MAKNKVSIKRLIQNPTINKKNASIIIITHEAKSSSFKSFIYLKKKIYCNTPKIIRIEKFNGYRKKFLDKFIKATEFAAYGALHL